MYSVRIGSKSTLSRPEGVSFSRWVRQLLVRWDRKRKPVPLKSFSEAQDLEARIGLAFGQAADCKIEIDAGGWYLKIRGLK